MSEELKTVLLWYRNDLRILDHQGLNQAMESGHRVVAYYTFNPRHYQTHPLGFKKTDKFRAQFNIESIEALKASLKALNISLIIEQKAPEEGLPRWIDELNVKAIHLQNEWTEEEKEKKPQ